jgi:hypothetical protein
MKASPLCEDEGQQTEWLEYIQENPIPDCLQYYDYDHIATIFDGTARIEKDEEPEKPTRKPVKPADDDEPAPAPRTGRRAPTPDPDDKPAPARSIRTSSRGIVVDDDGEPPPEPAPRARTRVQTVVVDDADDDEPSPVEVAKPSLRERLRARKAEADED